MAEPLACTEEERVRLPPSPLPASPPRSCASALDALPQVARTGTHLFQFASFVEGFRGWGRSLRGAVGRWYAARSIDALAYQASSTAGATA